MGLFQEISVSALDEVPCEEELRLFHDDMGNWQTLELDMVTVLRTLFLQFNSLPKDPDDRDFLNAIVLLHNLTNGISNCTKHIIRYLVRRAATVEDYNVQHITEVIAANFKHTRQKQFTFALNNCDCNECRDVIAVDQRYDIHGVICFVSCHLSFFFVT